MIIDKFSLVESNSERKNTYSYKNKFYAYKI